MRRYLLDSDILSGYALGAVRLVALVAPWVVQHEAVTSVIAFGETVERIIHWADFPARHKSLQAILDNIVPLPVTMEVTRRYAEIRSSLRLSNALIGDMDTLIAATAIEHGLMVVSTNINHFGRVPDLKLLHVAR
ncbi:MAG: type II toxin-antitoxin system VapC family toxin [Chloroflexota bacterium]